MQELQNIQELANDFFSQAETFIAKVKEQNMQDGTLCNKCGKVTGQLSVGICGDCWQEL